jgi:hypothetical protein
MLSMLLVVLLALAIKAAKVPSLSELTRKTIIRSVHLTDPYLARLHDSELQLSESLLIAADYLARHGHLRPALIPPLLVPSIGDALETPLQVLQACRQVAYPHLNLTVLAPSNRLLRKLLLIAITLVSYPDAQDAALVQGPLRRMLRLSSCLMSQPPGFQQALLQATVQDHVQLTAHDCQDVDAFHLLHGLYGLSFQLPLAYFIFLPTVHAFLNAHLLPVLAVADTRDLLFGPSVLIDVLREVDGIALLLPLSTVHVIAQHIASPILYDLPRLLPLLPHSLQQAVLHCLAAQGRHIDLD